MKNMFKVFVYYQDILCDPQELKNNNTKTTHSNKNITPQNMLKGWKEGVTRIFSFFQAFQCIQGDMGPNPKRKWTIFQPFIFGGLYLLLFLGLYERFSPDMLHNPLQGRPLPVIDGVITAINRVITTVSHLQGHL